MTNINSQLQDQEQGIEWQRVTLRMPFSNNLTDKYKATIVYDGLELELTKSSDSKTSLIFAKGNIFCSEFDSELENMCAVKKRKKQIISYLRNELSSSESKDFFLYFRDV
jgi:hypothetical protein